MKKLIEEFGKQLTNGIRSTQSIHFSKPKHEIRNVVISGMGTSGIGAELVKSVVFKEAVIPISILKSYELPAYVNKNTLFIASSFSGNTEETLSVLEAAIQANAEIACITSGGKILKIAEEKKTSLAQMPADAPASRAFLGFSFIQLFYILKSYEIISDNFEIELQESVWLLESDQKKIQKIASEIAADLKDSIPVLYADSKFEPVIERLRQQLNENAKNFAHTNVFPEMNHNELVSYEKPELFWKNAVVLNFKTDYDHARVKLRMSICEPIFKERVKKMVEIVAMGDSQLEQSIYLIHLADWISWFLSEKNGVEALEVKNIDYLKNILAVK